MNSFIEQTAQDYDLDISAVSHLYRLYWPDIFYDKLEELKEIVKISHNQSPPKKSET